MSLGLRNMNKHLYSSPLFEKWSWDIKRITHNSLSYSIEAGSKDIRIGIVDSGIDGTHPDLKDALCSSGKSFIDEAPLIDSSGHGTMIAGQIAANGGLFGIGPGLGLVPYKVINEDNKGDSATIITAIDQAISDEVDIINLSLGTYKSPVHDQELFAEYKAVLRKANEKGIIVVASAGTHGVNIKQKVKDDWILHIPGGLKEVVSVQGVNKQGQIAGYSNFGKGVRFATPSGDYGTRWQTEGKINIKNMCLVNYPLTIAQSPLSKAAGFPHGYEFMIGTSLASAKLSGAIGVLQSYALKKSGKKLTKGGVLEILEKSAKSPRKNTFHSAQIDLYKALLLLNHKL